MTPIRLSAQLTVDTTDPGKLMPSYVFPADQEVFSEVWWRYADAAEAWGCSFSCAKRLIDRHPKETGRTVVWLVSPRGASARVVIPRGTERPKTRPGNPNWIRQKRPDVVE